MKREKQGGKESEVKRDTMRKIENEMNRKLNRI